MGGYYWSVVREIPKHARSKTEQVMFWVVILIAVAGAFRPELAQKASEAWIRGFSIVVLAVALGQAALRVNYAKVQQLQRTLAEANSLIATEQARRAVKTALGNAKMEFGTLQQACHMRSRPEAEIHAAIEDASARTVNYVRQFFDAGEVSQFVPVHALELDLVAQQLVEDGARGYANLYMMAQNHSRALSVLIAKMPADLTVIS